MSKEILKEEFKSLCEIMIPQDAHPMQVLDMKRSFYAGASVSFALISEAIFKGESAEVIIAYLDRIKNELISFANEQEKEEDKIRAMMQQERYTGGKLDS